MTYRKILALSLACTLAFPVTAFAASCHAADLYHGSYGRLCPGKKTLCGTYHYLYTDRMRNGASETGYPDSADPRNVVAESV